MEPWSVQRARFRKYIVGEVIRPYYKLPVRQERYSAWSYTTESRRHTDSTEVSLAISRLPGLNKVCCVVGGREGGEGPVCHQNLDLPQASWGPTTHVKQGGVHHNRYFTTEIIWSPTKEQRNNPLTLNVRMNLKGSVFHSR